MSIMKAHGLFPQEGEEPPTEVETIQVYAVVGGARRYKGNLQAQDLPDEDAVLRTYGNGTFELHARARNRITRKRLLILGDGPAEATNVAPGVVHAGGGGMEMMLPLIQLIVQQSQAQSSQIMAMMTGFMQAADTKSQQMIAAQQQTSQQMMQMQTSQTAAQIQVMTEFFKASSANAGGAGNAKEVFGLFKEGMQFAKDNLPAAAKKAAESGVGGFAGNIDAFSNALGALAVAKQSGVLGDVLGMLKTEAPAKPAAPTAPARALPPASSAPPSPQAHPASQTHPSSQPAPPQARQAPPVAPQSASPLSPPLPPPPASAQNAPRTIVQVPNIRARMHAPTTSPAPARNAVGLPG